MLTLGKLGLCLAGLRLLPLTIFALMGFATNSLLTRAAIRAEHLDAWTFMVVRLITGAIMLWVLVALRGAKEKTSGVFLAPAGKKTPDVFSSSSWLMAIWLAGYAVLFTLAYERIEAGPGALLLFGSVQLTMFAAALARGETLSVRHGLGVAIALAGFLVLTLPGLSAPDPLGAVLMAGAGACWGAYSLAGRGATDPLGVTAHNFLRAAVIGVLIALAAGASGQVGMMTGPFTLTGLALASASGAFASGLAYAAWYAVLPALPVWRAATVQLAVPVLTALAATIFLNEQMTWRLSASMVLVVAGIGLATMSRSRTR
ncbi:MAG: DMT family transporter [Acidobacteria bacterium]|nr:DMT family transporter [Acidobacteriota bacterium]